MKPPEMRQQGTYNLAKSILKIVDEKFVNCLEVSLFARLMCRNARFNHTRESPRKEGFILPMLFVVSKLGLIPNLPRLLILHTSFGELNDFFS